MSSSFQNNNTENDYYYHSGTHTGNTIGKFSGKECDFSGFKISVETYFASQGLQDLLIAPDSNSSGNSVRMSFGGINQLSMNKKSIENDIQLEEELPLKTLLLSPEQPYTDATTEQLATYIQEANNVKQINLVLIEDNKNITANNAQVVIRNKKLTSQSMRKYKACSIIIGALSTDVFKFFQHILPGHPNALWKAICDKYDGKQLVDKTYTRKILYTAMKLAEGEDIDAYVSRINHYANILAEQNAPVSEDELIYILYEGLPESYTFIIMTLKQQEGGKLSFDELTRRLREHQMNYKNIQKLSAMKLAAITSSTTSTSTSTSTSTPATAHYVHNTNTNITSSSKHSICFRCGKKGHKKPECTLSFENTKCTVCDRNGHLAEAHGIGFNTKQKPAVGNKVNKPYTSQHRQLPLYEYVSIVQQKVLAFTSELQSTVEWLIDSGASRHFTGNLSLLTSNIQMVDPITLVTASGEEFTANTIGTCTIIDSHGEHINIPNVMYCKGLTTNLLSLSQMQQNGATSLDLETNVLHYRNGNNIQLIKDGNLYKILSKLKPSNITTNNNLTEIPITNIVSINTLVSPIQSAESNTINQSKGDATIMQLSESQQLHYRFGHVGIGNLESIIKNDAVIGIDLKSINTDELQFCEGCSKGKAHRHSFNKNKDSDVKGILYRVHSDLCGPIRSTADGKYLITITDEYSRYIYGKIIATKDLAEKVITNWILLVENDRGVKLKEFHSDGGGEFTSNKLNEFFTNKGILATTTMRSMPERNGIAERANRSIFELARSMLQHAHLPNYFWGEACLCAIYIRNRCTTKGGLKENTGKTPYELWYGKKPNVTHLRVFGCDVHVHIIDELRDGKLDAKSSNGIFVGYDDIKNGYLIFDINTKKITTQRNVKFNENSFNHITLINTTSESTNIYDLFNDIPIDDENEYNNYNDYLLDNEIELVKQLSLEEIPIESITSNIQPISEVEIAIKNELLVEDEKQLPPTELPIATTNELPITSIISHEIKQGRRIGTRVKKQTNFSGMFKKGDFVQTLIDIKEDVEEENLDEVATITPTINNESIFIPSNYYEAMNCQDAHHWKAAMQDEYNSLITNDTWELVELPPDRKAIGSRWVFTVKLNSDGSIERYKARFCAKGFTQREGIDYNDTFAPVVKYTTLRILLSIITIKNYELKQMDVKTAFLNALMKELVYMKQADGFNDGSDKVCLLLKTLYGTKQAPHEWNEMVDAFMIEMGWIACISDPCLYWKISQTNQIMLCAVFVDDFISGFATIDTDEYNIFKDAFMKKFKTTDLGDAKWVLKMEIIRDRNKRTLTLSQNQYNKKVVNLFGLQESKSTVTPEVVNNKLSKLNCPLHNSDEQIAMNNTPYESLVGSLLYAAISTRPDLSHAVNRLARYMKNPGKLHWKAGKTAIRYLHGTENYGLLFTGYNDADGSEKDIIISAYSDADWAGDVDDRKSTSGYLVYVGGNLISWSSRKQPTISLSSAEAEYMACTETVKEILWIRSLLSELTFIQKLPTILKCDNKSAITFTENRKMSKQLKHIDIKYSFIKRAIKLLQVQLQWVPTTDQLADILTKALGPKPFNTIKNKLVYQIGN